MKARMFHGRTVRGVAARLTIATALLSAAGVFGTVGAQAADAAVPDCSGGTCTETFTPTGSLQTLSVPTGVTSVVLTVKGGARGRSDLRDRPDRGDPLLLCGGHGRPGDLDLS
jgi:hypothetical protein